MRRFFGILAAIGLLLAAVGPAASAEDDATVRAVLFFSPTCPHCHEVIDNQLPDIFEDFGGDPTVVFDETLPSGGVSFYLVGNGTLDLLLVDVSVEPGSELYEASTVAQGVPEAMLGVPRLVVGEEFFVGSRDIPGFFPAVIEAGLAAGGIDWPNIPGIDRALAAIPEVADDPPDTVSTVTLATEVPASTEAPPTTADTTPATFPDIESTPVSPLDADLESTDDSVWGKFNRDVAGNTLAVVVLLAMTVSLVMVFALARRGSLPDGISWWIPLLAVAGVGVAVYLTYLETSGADAVCGPVGDCNAVQQSKYSELFGFIPVGVVGLVGYPVVVGPWLVARFGRGRSASWASVAMLAGTVVGVGFSIYLTFLEPFVIGATCMWCLSSAVIVTLLMWLSAGPGWAALQRLTGR